MYGSQTSIKETQFYFFWKHSEKSLKTKRKKLLILFRSFKLCIRAYISSESTMPGNAFSARLAGTFSSTNLTSSIEFPFYWISLLSTLGLTIVYHGSSHFNCIESVVWHSKTKWNNNNEQTSKCSFRARYQLGYDECNVSWFARSLDFFSFSIRPNKITPPIHICTLNIFKLLEKMFGKRIWVRLDANQQTEYSE